jgi:hypothetical protein
MALTLKAAESSCCSSLLILPPFDARVPGGGGLEDRREAPARTAPLSPEVEEDDPRLVHADVVVEVVLGDLDGVDRGHSAPFLVGSRSAWFAGAGHGRFF